MKRLFYLIAIIGIPVIAFFQFENYRKLHAPDDYTLTPNPDIDVDYYDATQVSDYYNLLQQAKSYAGFCWKEYRLNVKSTDPVNPKHGEYLKRYHAYLAAAQKLEQKLLRSAALKQKGHTDESIQQLENGTQTGDLYRAKIQQLAFDRQVLSTKGDRSSLVFETQKMLDSLGYEMPVDGFFSTETEEGLQNFQNDQKLFPSGNIDNLTFRTLLSRFSVN